MTIYLLTKRIQDKKLILKKGHKSLDAIQKNEMKPRDIKVVIESSKKTSRNHFTQCQRILKNSKKYNLDLIMMLPFDRVGIEAVRRIKRFYPNSLILSKSINSIDQLKFAEIIGCDYVWWNQEYVISLNESVDIEG